MAKLSSGPVRRVWLSGLAGCVAIACISPAIARAEPAETESAPLPFDALPSDASAPLGGLALSPTRLQLVAGGRGATLTIYNTGNSPATFRAELTEIALDETGNLRPLREGETASWAATPYLRFSPHQVTLQPGQRQVIRVVVRGTSDLPPQELRSHMLVYSIPLVTPVQEVVEGSEAAPSSSAQDAPSSSQVSVSVGLDYQISIPVLVRVGEPGGGVRIAAAKEVLLSDNRRGMRVVLQRLGPATDFGTLRVLDATGTELGRMRRVGVLPPGPARELAIPLNMAGKPARVVFEPDDATAGQEIIFELP